MPTNKRKPSFTDVQNRVLDVLCNICEECPQASECAYPRCGDISCPVQLFWTHIEGL